MIIAAGVSKPEKSAIETCFDGGKVICNNSEVFF